MHEISSAGNKDDKEVISLKRLKTELESKLQEQEEELDEQAGVIQQLEQVCVIEYLSDPRIERTLVIFSVR